MSAQYEYFGDWGPGVVRQSGGTNSCLYVFELGVQTGVGNYTLSNTGFLSSGAESLGGVGTGILTQTGGTNSISDSLVLGQWPGGSGTYNFSGGLLVTPALSGGSGSAAFNFGGGTLQASGSLTTTVPMTLTGSGGNATVDTAGYTVTLSGSLSGSGGLVKTDSGTLVLAASNTYTGGTIVEAGILVASNGSPVPPPAAEP